MLYSVALFVMYCLDILFSYALLSVKGSYRQKSYLWLGNYEMKNIVQYSSAMARYNLSKI